MIPRRMVRACTAVVIIIASMLSGALPAGASGGSFGGGDGTADDPYVIEDVWDLQNMSGNLSAHYVLKDDIDASTTRNWNSGAGFAPVGTYVNRFTGSMDGRNHTIAGLFINRSTSWTGLFGYVDKGGSVVNVGLADIEVTGRDYVGGLAGELDYGTVSNVHSVGNVTGGHHVGGLIGRMDHATVDHANFTGSVSGRNTVGGLVGDCVGYSGVEDSYAAGNMSGDWYTAGLIGIFELHCTLANSYSTAKVTGGNCIGGLVGMTQYQCTLSHLYATGNVTGSAYTGGLVGQIYHNTIVSGCYAMGDIIVRASGSMPEKGGGFAGSNAGTLIDCHATGNVTGVTNSNYLGGLVGDNNGGTVSGSHATGNVTTGGYLGGLVGMSSGIVSNSYATGNVVSGSEGGGLVAFNDHGTVNGSYAIGNTEGFSGVGGLVGCSLNGTVSNSHAIGNVDGASHVGGLVGSLTEGTLSDSYARGNVTGTFRLGGLAGSNYYGTVSNAFATGNVTGKTILFGDQFVGGLIGLNHYGTVKWSYSKGDVIGLDSSVGGLVGQNFHSSVNSSYATGSVTGHNNSVGGLVGGNVNGTVANSYATGNATARYDHVGGLVGQNDNGTVSNSYSTGSVNGTSHIGGLVGRNGATVSSCFWDTNASGMNSSDGGTGKTTAGMMTRSTFTDAGWDFTTVWTIVQNATYPYLRWQGAAAPLASAGTDQAVFAGTLVTFDGSGSTDDLGIANYTWTFTDGTAVTLHGVRPTYRFENKGVFVVTLNVTANHGLWDVDTVTITVMGQDITAPTADAGPDQTVNEMALVTLDGSGSTDDVGVANYTWTFTDGVPVRLYGVKPAYWFSTPGTFVVTLNVTDAASNWDADTVTVTVNDTTPPRADAGGDRTVGDGAQVTLDGSGTTDLVGVVNYTWTFVVGTERTVLYGVAPSYTFTVPGVYAITLRVADAAGNWREDSMNLTVDDVTAPVAGAGPDRSVPVGSAVPLDGSPSTDNVGTTGFAWTFTYDGQARALEGAVVQFTFALAGTYEVILTVTDQAGNHGEDAVVITVVGTGRVAGRVLDSDGGPVEGATVEVAASDGMTYSTTTAANGSFALDVPHGDFTWKVHKEGYSTMSGSSSVGPMDATTLDISAPPVVKEPDEGSSLLLYLVPMVGVVLIVVGVVLFGRKGKQGETHE